MCRVGCNITVGIATRCELDTSVIESRYWRGFLHPSRRVLRPTRTILWAKAAGVWRWLYTPHSTEVKERVLFFLFGPSRPVAGEFYLCSFFFRLHVLRELPSVSTLALSERRTNCKYSLVNMADVMLRTESGTFWIRNETSLSSVSLIYIT